MFNISERQQLWSAARGITIVLTNSASGANTYGYVNFSGGAATSLTATDTGTYAGFIVVSDPRLTPTSVEDFSGGTGMSLQGIIYSPKGSVDVSGANAVTGCVAMVAYKFNFSGVTTFNGSCTAAAGLQLPETATSFWLDRTGIHMRPLKISAHGKWRGGDRVGLAPCRFCTCWWLASWTSASWSTMISRWPRRRAPVLQYGADYALQNGYAAAGTDTAVTAGLATAMPSATPSKIAGQSDYLYCICVPTGGTRPGAATSCAATCADGQNLTSLRRPLTVSKTDKIPLALPYFGATATVTGQAVMQVK